MLFVILSTKNFASKKNRAGIVFLFRQKARLRLTILLFYKFSTKLNNEKYLRDKLLFVA
jgi:hypothetical protein